MKHPVPLNTYYFLLYNKNIWFDFADELKIGGLEYFHQN